jgi:hypothetical protein
VIALELDEGAVHEILTLRASRPVSMEVLTEDIYTGTEEAVTVLTSDQAPQPRAFATARRNW